MYLDPIRAVGAAAQSGFRYEYSPTGLSRMVRIKQPKPKVRTAEELIAIKARNDFLAQVAANKSKSKRPSQSMFSPMPVRYR